MPEAMGLFPSEGAVRGAGTSEKRRVSIFLKFSSFLAEILEFSTKKKLFKTRTNFWIVRVIIPQLDGILYLTYIGDFYVE